MLVSGFYFAWELWILTGLQSFMGPAAAAFMSFWTLFGEEAVLVLLLSFIYWGIDRKLGERIGINILTSICICPMIKNVFLRYRPYFVIPEVRCIRPARQGDIFDIAVQGYSFPSGHACGSAATYGTITAYSEKKPVKAACILLIFLICLSRVCLGVHFPTDVLAGAFIGAAVILLNGLLIRDGEHRDLVLLGIIAVCSAGLFYCRTEDYFTSYGVLTGGLAGMMFEKRHVRFENAGSFAKALVRTAAGIAVFLAVSYLLKLTSGLISVPEHAALMIRAARYAVSSFLTIGIYPFAFRLEKN